MAYPARRAHDDDPTDTGAGAAHAALLKFLEAKLRPSDLDQAQLLVEALFQAGQEQPGTGTIGTSPQPGAGAMDGYRYAMDSDPVHRMMDIQAARAEVEPVVGAVVGDGATEIFRTALTKLGIESRGIHYTALPTVFRQARRSGVRPAAPAMDSRTSNDLERRFPHAARIGIG